MSHKYLNTEFRRRKPESSDSVGICLFSLIAFILNSVFCILYSSSAFASDVSLHGFLQGGYSFDAASSNPDGGDFKWAEERLQIKLDASGDPFRIFIKADGWYNHINQKADAELREGYADYTAGKWDLRAGRQVVTWGLGDLVFINDVFPKDYEAFFSGRPLEYLKKGIDGAKLGIYPDFASFEFIAIPFFTPNHFPGSKAFWMFDPMPEVTAREEIKPSSTAGNTEIAIRAYRDVGGADASIYFYKGFYRQPSVMPDSPSMPARLTLFYPRLNVYGASLQARALDGVLSLEAGHYESRQDKSGTDPIIPNSQTRFLIGYQRQLLEDLIMGIQYYGEYMHNYSGYSAALPQGLPLEKRLHDLASIRLTQFLIHQTLRLSFFAFYSPSDKDYMLNPEIKYNFSDHIWSAAGANIFGGSNPQTQFGQLDRNDNLYLQMRYEF